MQRFFHLLVSVLALLLWSSTLVHADTISRYQRLTGNYNYVATGGSLRNSSNSVNACSLASSSSQALSGIPSGASIVAAYLYWGGSGATIDSTVSLNGNSVTANRTFTNTPSATNTAFFGGFADVTSLITTSTSNITFSGLTVDSSSTYCNNGTVMSGWALVVVYEKSTEPLRAINIFDGLDSFFGSGVSLTPDGFRIPTSSIDGKMTAITWEGDPGNSDSRNGYSESLTFNGNTLDDGVVPTGSSPTTQQYDGTISNLGTMISDTSYGVDVDTYNVSSYLSAGASSATTYYSAGGDLVFLAAQIISVTSEPQVDLSIAMTQSAAFSVGSNGSYVLTVSNAAGVQAVDYLTTVTDTLPTGLTFVSGTGTGWTCSANAQVVTCTHPAPLAAGSAFPAITLTVTVGNAAYASVTNTASVATAGSNDFVSSNNTTSLTSAVAGSNLSTSTKTVSDLNGGEADVGDVLQYTITLINSSSIAATGVSVTDPLPGNTTGLTVVSVPSGATNSSTTSAITITGLSVPANSSVSVVFNVTIASGTSAGAVISNTATISNPAGAGATPSAPDVQVSPSKVAGSGTKQLYLLNNSSNTQKLSRNKPTGTHNNVSVAGNNGAITWTLTPALQAAVTLNSGSYPVYLVMARTGDSGGGMGGMPGMGSGGSSDRNISVQLSNSVIGSVGTASMTLTNMNTSATLYTYTLNLSSSVTLPVGSTLTLTITNTSSSSTATVNVTPYSNSDYSRVELNSATVINVDSVATYSAAYSSTVTASSFVRGSTAYIRAVVSDPFGSFDISSASISLLNPSGTSIVSSASMTQVYDSDAATKIYEYAYALPSTAVAGIWTARIIANEGSEGTITDLGVGTFTVTMPLPTLSISKISSVVSDPINGTTNPKRIPGSVVLYTITVTNSGTGSVDASTLVLTDVIPTNTVLCISSSCGGAVSLVDGSVSSGLTFNSAGLSYSNSSGGGTPFSYTPSADSNGYDANITGLRIAPTGAMNGVVTSGSNPSFSVNFRVKVK